MGAGAIVVGGAVGGGEVAGGAGGAVEGGAGRGAIGTPAGDSADQLPPKATTPWPFVSPGW